jgi:Kdo2-lipid IVA lauroyltransferase/acyltransferase
MRSRWAYCLWMNLKNGYEYALFRALLAVLGSVPPRRAADSLAALGRFTGSALRIRRRVVESQLEAIFPELGATDRRALAVKIYDHLGRTVGEVFGSGVEDLLAKATVEPGWEIVDEALSAGRGAIVATGHIGNFELGGALIAGRYPLLDVVKTQRNTAFDGYVESLRHARGVRTVPMREPGRAVLHQLRAGGLVSLLIDQDAGTAGVATQFLGRPASTWTGAARFSIRTGCPVIPMAMFRRAPGRHVLRISPCLEPAGLSDCAADISAYTARISSAVEAFIWKAPEQWFWVHRRWKSAARKAE